MPINVFCKSSNNFERKIDTSLFVKKSLLRTIVYLSNLEKYID